ncbi:hypothetical protein [Streptomyces melanogenes]|uniref:hypothetical protein n=1 Tax=Streptomyces melanogenes TaxID=67326 RepID=UPI003792D95A
MGQLRWPRAARGPWTLAGLLALALLAPAVPAAAGEGSCTGKLAERLECWAKRVGTQDAAVVTLHRPLELDGKTADLKLKEREAVFGRGPLVVMVPAGHPTGAGGTLLLVLAGDRLVDKKAEITRLDDKTVTALREAGACEGNLCELVAQEKGKGATVSGDKLVDARLAADLDLNADSVGGSGGGSSLLVPALGVAALLLLLVTALVFAVRRSRGPRLAFAAPAPTGRTAVRSTASAAEPPGRHRAAPGRDVRRPSSPGRVAVVRTALHPQGYVELDQCLRRAVWAEPGEPAPAPGSSVEVSEGRGKDAGILYAHACAEDARTVIDRARHGS